MSTQDRIFAGLDQQTEQTGYALIINDDVLEFGTIVTPPNYGALASRQFQARRIHELLHRWRLQHGRAFDVVGLEGTYLQESVSKTGRRVHNVTTLQALDRLAGAVEYAATMEQLEPYTVPVQEVTRYLGLAPNSIRIVKKQGAMLMARHLLSASGNPLVVRDDWDEVVTALREASDTINNWNPNLPGQPKTSETLLKHADKQLLALGCSSDSCDALIIANITRAAIGRRELMGESYTALVGEVA